MEQIRKLVDKTRERLIVLESRVDSLEDDKDDIIKSLDRLCQKLDAFITNEQIHKNKKLERELDRKKNREQWFFRLIMTTIITVPLTALIMEIMKG